MKKRFLAMTLAFLTLTACAREDPAASLSADTTSISTPAAAEAPSAAAGAVSEDEIQEIIDHTAIFFPGNTAAYIRGSACTLSPAPFLEDGVLYVPAATVAALMGGSFVEAGEFCYLNYLGNVSIMTEEYNVLLFNSDAVIMDRTPIVRDGVFCLPLASMGQALSMRCAKSACAGIFVLGVPSDLSEAELAAISQTLTGSAPAYQPQPELAAMGLEFGLEPEELESAAKQRSLWLSDENGAIQKLWLDDAGALKRESYLMSYAFPAEQVFVSENSTLRSLTSGDTVPATPDELYRQELRRATGRYMELKAAQSVLHDATAQSLLECYRNVLDGKLDDPAYLADQASPYETGLYPNRAGEEAWTQLVRSARPGDFLVFSAAGAGPEYGFFNHSALILEVDTDSGTMRLLHARSSEYGVGADLDMDRLSFSGFEDISYYQDYETVFLCRAGDLTQSRAASMAWDAYDRFNNYQFGYGGRMGLEETNCAELIVDAYSEAGVEILDGDYETRLKEVLKGNTRNLVPIPDDLLFSPEVEVISVWRR